MPIRIIVADDHSAVRAGLRAIIQSRQLGTVVAEAKNPDGLLRALRTVACDMVLADFSMPGGRQADGMRMLEHIQARFPALPVLVVTMYAGVAMLRALRSAGVAGVFTKCSSLSELPAALRRVRSGRFYASPDLLDAIAPGTIDDLGDIPSLTRREAEVVGLLASGNNLTQIARMLKKTVSTVSAQKVSAATRLGTKSDKELLDYVNAFGLRM